MELTPEEIDAIKAEAATYAGENFTTYDLGDNDYKIIKETAIHFLSTERQRAKVLLDAAIMVIEDWDGAIENLKQAINTYKQKP